MPEIIFRKNNRDPYMYDMTHDYTIKGKSKTMVIAVVHVDVFSDLGFRPCPDPEDDPRDSYMDEVAADLVFRTGSA